MTTTDTTVLDDLTQAIEDAIDNGDRRLSMVLRAHRAMLARTGTLSLDVIDIDYPGGLRRWTQPAAVAHLHGCRCADRTDGPTERITCRPIVDDMLVQLYPWLAGEDAIEAWHDMGATVRFADCADGILR